MAMIMDYEKKYKEALERAKKLHKDAITLQLEQDIKDYEYIFPELKDEDERIRKEMIGFFKGFYDNKMIKAVDVEPWLAWLEKQSIDISSFPEEQQVFMQKYTGLDKITLIKLLAERDANNAEIIESFEKQGEKKPIEPQQDMLSQEKYAKAVDECVYGEQKPADKVEPKFKSGDWVVSEVTGSIYQIKNCIENLSNHKYGYDLINGGYISSDEVNHYHLWTIQDAKDGDILCDGTTIFIFKDLLSDGSVMSYCDYDTDSGESDAFCPLSVNLMCSKITPATKERRDTLMEAIADAGYTFDFDKKELKKIEQKPAWSEEDEKRLQSCLNVLQARGIMGVTETVNTKWLKSLKDRAQPHPKQEWNEEDKQHIDSLLKRLDALCRNKFERTRFAISEDRDWLKSLRPQNTWKPSDKQMKALGVATNICNVPEKEYLELEKLYQDLKKLKEE